MLENKDGGLTGIFLAAGVRAREEEGNWEGGKKERDQPPNPLSNPGRNNSLSPLPSVRKTFNTQMEQLPHGYTAGTRCGCDSNARWPGPHTAPHSQASVPSRLSWLGRGDGAPEKHPRGQGRCQAATGLHRVRAQTARPRSQGLPSRSGALQRDAHQLLERGQGPVLRPKTQETWGQTPRGGTSSDQNP